MPYIVVFFAELLVLFFLSREFSKELSRLFYRITKSHSVTIHLLAFLLLPGTIIHELAHLFMAMILFVPTGSIELFPKSDGNYIKLGSVAIAKTDPLRRAIIGMAPFIVGTIILLTAIYYLPTYSLKTNPAIVLGLVYILFEVGNTMFSSRKDMEGTLELLIFFLIVYLILFFLGIRLPTIQQELLIPHSLLSIFKNGSLYLLIPLTINILTILILRISNKAHH